MSQDRDAAHRELREQLGAYALGGLPDRAQARLRAHLEGCRACRAELAGIAPLADALRLVPAEAFAQLPVPPADLGDRILDRIAQEREATPVRLHRDRAVRSRRLATAAAAAVLLVAALVGGTLLGRATAPELTAAPARPLPVEDIRLRAVEPSVEVEAAVVVAHTWGVEAQFRASGLDTGEVYRAAFRSEDGRLLPAGEFLGVGDTPLTCNMQAALLRDDTAGFVVTDESGQVVLTADL